MSSKNKGALWNRNNPLTFYGNEMKLNDLIGRIWGEVVNEISTETKKGNKTNAKLKAGLGKLMAIIGVGDISAEIGTETSKELVSKKVASIPFEAKQELLVDYLVASGSIPYIDAHNGMVLQKINGIPVSKWPAIPLDGKDNGSYIGIVLGLFTAIREDPPGAEGSALVQEILRSANSLWVLKSIEEAKIHVEIPILLRNIRFGSQLGMLTILRSWNSNFKVESFGLLNWESNNLVVCDPISWRLFH